MSLFNGVGIEFDQAGWPHEVWNVYYSQRDEQLEQNQ